VVIQLREVIQVLLHLVQLEVIQDQHLLKGAILEQLLHPLEVTQALLLPKEVIQALLHPKEAIQVQLLVQLVAIRVQHHLQEDTQVMVLLHNNPL